jgi:hypothetical protein
MPATILERGGIGMTTPSPSCWRSLIACVDCANSTPPAAPATTSSYARESQFQMPSGPGKVSSGTQNQFEWWKPLWVASSTALT